MVLVDIIHRYIRRKRTKQFWGKIVIPPFELERRITLVKQQLYKKDWYNPIKKALIIKRREE